MYSEVDAVSRDLPVVHPAKPQWLGRPHHVGDLADLLIDAALGIEQRPTANNSFEHRFPDTVVAAAPIESLLGAVVNARCSEGTQQEAYRADDLVVSRLVPEAACWLPERVVVVDEGHQVAADFPPGSAPGPCSYDVCAACRKK